MGELSVLNMRAGDIRVKVTNDNAIEKARAKKMIADMLSRGYLLAIEKTDGTLEKVDGFDPQTEEYIVIESAAAPVGYECAASDDSEAPEKSPAATEQAPAKRTSIKQATKAKQPKGKPRGAYKQTRVPMENAKVTAVPRTGGG